MRANHFLLLLAIFLSFAGQANASYWFKVIDITPVDMLADSQSNFTVSVKGLGSERAYVELVFRNVSEGLTIICPKKIQNVFPQGVTEYDCIVMAGDLAPGNYSFVADVVAAGAPSGKMTGYVNIMGEDGSYASETVRGDQAALRGAEEPKEAEEPEKAEEPGEAGENAPEPAARPIESEKKSPASGALAAGLALFLASWRMKR
ncbi:MAG: hypothetical protein WAZ20_10505 [Methanothrix sp.]|mgnify:CR=1 FL=1|jgi:hypothetical protein|uniref:hypothetical protein n=1 Tax=Methanothrix sp. TaxID=90426 RepID=UPI002B7EEF4B|nr:hypothetical protein [Methanothrix sp.]